MIDLWLLRARKLVIALRRPDFRRAFLRHRVVPSIEFSGLPFRDSYRTVLDVGANRGQFSLFARARFPQASILAFEPGPAAAAIFEDLFRDDPATHLARVALGAQRETRSLRVPARDDGASFVLDVGSAPTIEVPVETIDAQVSQIDRPSLLKIDVQGFELEVLRGATRALQAIDDVLVECTFDPAIEAPPAEQVIALLVDAGFRVIAAQASGPWGDLLFRRVAGTLNGAAGQSA